ncbi:MAG: hypothetical protein LBU83_00730 [Bacteroidales bacterium]|jgi:hypothetical protein|nr:hypothetical protein [Bacteroidales bacterium]
MKPKTSISPNNSRKGVAFEFIFFPLVGLSKSSRALCGNEHGSMAEMPHLQNMEWRPQIGTIRRYEINAVNIENLARATAVDVKRTTYHGLEIPENLLHDTHRNIKVPENSRDVFYDLKQLPEKIIRGLEAIYKYRPFPYFY